MLKRKVREKPEQASIPITLNCKGFCPNITKVMRKHWNVLAINESLKKIFNCQPITAFKQNKKLKELIGGSKIEKNKKKKKKKEEIEKKKVKKRQIQKLKPGKCSPCLTNLRSICYKQVLKTTTLTSQQAKKIHKIFHNVICASSYAM